MQGTAAELSNRISIQEKEKQKEKRKKAIMVGTMWSHTIRARYTHYREESGTTVTVKFRNKGKAPTRISKKASLTLYSLHSTHIQISVTYKTAPLVISLTNQGSQWKIVKKVCEDLPNISIAIPVKEL